MKDKPAVQIDTTYEMKPKSSHKMHMISPEKLKEFEVLEQKIKEQEVLLEACKNDLEEKCRLAFYAGAYFKMKSFTTDLMGIHCPDFEEWKAINLKELESGKQK